MSLLDDVRRTLRRHDQAGPTTRVVVAWSGGPDSTALLHLLRQLHESGELQLVAAAHLNHQLRDEATADEQYCHRVAAELGVPLTVERTDVRQAARRERRSLEDAAHRLRHAFFERAVALHKADVIAVGHTRDDQAETVLLRMIRGAGTRGMSGMHPRRGIVVRPLLECSRAAIRSFLHNGGIDFLTDASNADVSIPRNRVRAELLPMLVSRFNPRIVDALASEAGLARADQNFFDAVVGEWFTNYACRVAPNVWRLDGKALIALPPAVGWRVLQRGMSEAGRLTVSSAHVAMAWELAHGRAAAFDAPRQRVERVGSDVVLRGRSAGSTGRCRVESIQKTAAFSYTVPIPGEVTIPEIGSVVTAAVALSGESGSARDGLVAVVPKEKVSAGLVVRNRRPGDRLLPTRSGHRKLQDLLVDQKVPRDQRDRIPIVVDGAGRIVWVAGYAIDKDFEVSDPAQAVVILRLKAVGGSC